MIEPPVCEDEQSRLQALESLAILDTPPEERYDRITRIAQKLFDVPIALISLIDHDRQWFKSRQGLDARETERRISFCGHAILDDDILYVPDATLDERFFDNPLVTGEPHIRLYAGAPLRLADGHRLGTLCIIDDKQRSFVGQDLQPLRDLADLVEQELQSLRLGRAIGEIHRHDIYLRAVLNNIADGIVTFSEDGRIQAANPAAERIFACSAAQLQGRYFDTLVAEKDRNGLTATSGAIRHNLQDGIDITGVRRSGEYFPLYLSVSRTRLENSNLFVAVLQDVSERKRLESALQSRLQELHEKNHELESFSYSVSHDLRSPLRGLDGYSCLLLEDYGDRLDERGRQYLLRIRNAAQHMGQLIDDLLRLSDITRQNLDRQSVDLGELAGPIIDRLRHDDPRDDLTAVIGKDLLCWSDARLMGIALQNLLENAWKFTADTAAPVIELGVMEVDGERCFYVRDNGAGFDMRYAERLFRPFERLHNDGLYPGTGVGLAIVERIIRRHGGNIRAEAVPGGGAAFYFSLPEPADIQFRETG